MQSLLDTRFAADAPELCSEESLFTSDIGLQCNGAAIGLFAIVWQFRSLSVIRRIDVGGVEQLSGRPTLLEMKYGLNRVGGRIVRRCTGVTERRCTGVDAVVERAAVGAKWE